MAFSLIKITEIVDSLTRKLGKVIVTNTTGRNDMAVNDDGSINAGITGTVSVTASVLPPGAATAAKQDAQTAILTDIETNTGLSATELTLEAIRLLVASLDGNVTACDTTALATEATQADVKTAVESLDTKIATCDTDDVAINNFPTEYPLPASQVNDLTPPAAITGFSTETTLSAINGKLAAGFEVNEIENASATITYVGAETAAGVWWIRKMDSTSGSAIGHATEANNPTYTTYANAWTNRATLTYGNYSGAF